MITRATLALKERGTSSLRQAIKRTKIEYDSGNAYNKRWQWKWRQAYYTSQPLHEHTRVKTPEDSKEAPNPYAAWTQDWARRVIPGAGRV
jgi:hypothetical protein